GTPDDRKPGDAKEGAKQPAGVEYVEGENFFERVCRKIEAAAVIEEIDEGEGAQILEARGVVGEQHLAVLRVRVVVPAEAVIIEGEEGDEDRKSTRLNSSHVAISYAVFCLKK